MKRIIMMSLAALFLAGCGDEAILDGPSSDLRRAPLANQDIVQQIDDVFPEPGLVRAALKKLGNIERLLAKGQTADAQDQAIDFAIFTGELILKGQTRNMPTTEVELVEAIFTIPGLGLPAFAAGPVLDAVGADFAIAAVGVTGDVCDAATLTTSEGGFIVNIPGVTCSPTPTEPAEAAAGASASAMITGTLVVTASPCVADIDIDLPLFGPCTLVQAFDDTGPVTLTFTAELVEISVCGDLGILETDPRFDLITLHRQADDGSVEALPHTASACPPPPSSPELGLGSNPLVRFARAGWNKLTGVFGPKPLYATFRRRGDRGTGGGAPEFSKFQFALPAVMEKVSTTDGQTAQVDTDVTLKVRVVDAAVPIPQPVEGATVRFEIAPGGGGGSVAPMEALTNGSGIAQVDLTLDQVAGLNSVRAFGFGIADQGDGGPFLPTATIPTPLDTGEEIFTATGVPGPPTDISFTVQPTTTRRGLAISPAVEVTLTDAFANITTNATGDITLAIDNNPSGGTLSGTLAADVATTGVGTFSDLSIDQIGADYTLEASFAALSTTSALFDVIITVAGIGKNDGSIEADVVFSSGDLPGSITRLDEAAFNAKNVPTLIAEFDVLLITWDSDPTLNVDWNTRLKPFLEAGGGVIYDGDPNNVAELAPGIPDAAQLELGGSNITVTASIPGLTTGIVNSFTNNHAEFAATTFPVVPAGFTQFLTLTESHGAVMHLHNVGIFGPVGTGCIVLTGPDQDFHGERLGTNPEGNQYNLLVNELRFVTDPNLCL